MTWRCKGLDVFTSLTWYIRSGGGWGRNKLIKPLLFFSVLNILCSASCYNLKYCGFIWWAGLVNHSVFFYSILSLCCPQVKVVAGSVFRHEGQVHFCKSEKESKNTQKMRIIARTTYLWYISSLEKQLSRSFYCQELTHLRCQQITNHHVRCSSPSQTNAHMHY